jgi:hypothetical protein
VQLKRREDVYGAYWALASERQRIFLRRAAGDPGPWTTDPILQRFKFCNAYRASDRASQFLIREVIYAPGDFDADDTLLRLILFRLFSKPSTWTALEAELGPIGRSTIHGNRLAETLERLQAQGSIYTGAFILCATDAYGKDRKFLNHIELLRHMFRRRALPMAIGRARSLSDVYDALRRYPLIGPFMGYQLAIDINYSELVDFDEDEFTVPGPGAERGIRKVFPGVGKREMTSVIHWMTEHQAEETDKLGIKLATLFGRHLHAIDCQNLFCELDKYARVAFPSLTSNRRRIKATFRPTGALPKPFYPPKWGLNDRLPRMGASIAALA